MQTKNNQGFTLIEMVSAVIVLGIVAVITMPSLVGWMNYTQVKQGIAQIEGAIKEGQRQATRMGKQCQVIIDPVNNRVTAQTVEATPVTCLLSNRELNDNLDIETNDVTITFSGKGTPDNNADSVYIVHMPNGTDEQRCLVVSPGLGIMRSGRYNGEPATLNSNNCVEIPN